MKVLSNLGRALVCLLVLVCTSISDSGGSDARESEILMVPSGYYVSGNNICDADGNVHKFHGVSIPSMEDSIDGKKLYQNNVLEMASWNANVIRLPINQQYWLNDTEGYQARIDEIVNWIIDAGMDVIIDLHRLVPRGQSDMADDNSPMFWQQVANKYRNNPKVIFELYNEPRNISWDQWRNGGSNISGMKELYDTVRSTGAHNIVLIGGLNWAYSLEGVRDNPIDGYNIGYVTHLYDYGGKQPSDWADKWLFMADSAPVFITEFGPGPHDSQGTVLDYANSVFATAKAKHLHWTAWALWPYQRNPFIEGSYREWDPANDDFPLTPWGQLVKDTLLAQ